MQVTSCTASQTYEVVSDKKKGYGEALEQKIIALATRYQDVIYQNPLNKGGNGVFQSLYADLSEQEQSLITVKGMRELWMMRLCPNIIKGINTNEEDQFKLTAIYHESPGKWANIARIFCAVHGSSRNYYPENTIKNFFYRLRRRDLLTSSKTTSGIEFDEEGALNKELRVGEKRKNSCQHEDSYPRSSTCSTSFASLQIAPMTVSPKTIAITASPITLPPLQNPDFPSDVYVWSLSPPMVKAPSEVFDSLVPQADVIQEPSSARVWAEFLGLNPEDLYVRSS